MPRTTKELPRLIPTGTCWCGCGQETSLGAFFARGHDKLAEAALLAVEYEGSVARLLHKHGYHPGRSLSDHAIAAGVWAQCPECTYRGRPGAVRAHQAKTNH
jgi:hypothetical protein